MSECNTILKFRELYDRCQSVGLTLKTERDRFEFCIPEANGLISMDTLSEVELFVRGYELGYKFNRD